MDLCTLTGLDWDDPHAVERFNAYRIGQFDVLDPRTGPAFRRTAVSRPGGRVLVNRVIYCYPMTGVPGKRLPEGWDMIPGARGCTPQSWGFRDYYQQLLQFNTSVFGLSTQTTEYQREMADRLHLPSEILSDVEFKLCDATVPANLRSRRNAACKTPDSKFGTLLRLSNFATAAHLPVSDVGAKAELAATSQLLASRCGI
jgi:hypothetical protein